MDRKLLTTLQEIEKLVLRFSAINTFDELIEIIKVNIASIAPSDSMGLYLFDKEQKKLKLFYAQGFTESERQEAERTAMERHPGHVFATGEVVWVNDQLLQTDKHSIDSRTNAKTRSRLYVPVRTKDEIIGAFGIQSNLPDAFTEIHVALLKVFASLAADAYVIITKSNQLIAQNIENEKLSTLARNIRNNIIYTDAQGRITWVNHHFEAFTGYHLEEIMGKKPGSFLRGKNTESTISQKMSDAIANKANFNGTITNYKKSGEEYMVNIIMSPVFNPDGQLINFVSVQMDVTLEMERSKQLEVSKQKLEAAFDLLQVEQKKYSALVENTDELMTSMDAEGNITFANSAWLNKMGYTAEEVLHTSLFRYIHSLSQEHCMQIFSSLSESNALFQVSYSLISKAGERIEISGNVNLVYENKVLKSLHSYLTDVTQLNLNKLALQNYKVAIDKSSIVSITDIYGVITYVNDKFCEVSKYSRKELIGKRHNVVNSGYHSKEYIAECWNTISKGKVWQGLFKNRAKDGSFYWVNSTIVPFLKDGKIYQYVSVRHDITKQVELQLEVESQKLFYENILNHIPGNVAVFDEQGKYLFVNPNTIKNAAMRKWVIGKDNFEYCKHKGISDELAVERQQQFDLLRQNGNMINTVEKKLEKDGSYSYMNSTMLIHQYKGEKLIVAYGLDITAIKNAEEEIGRLKNFYENILDNIPEDVAVYDKNGIFVYLNPSAVKDNDLRKWLIGKDHYDYCAYRGLPLILADTRKSQYEELIETGKRLEFIEEKVLKNGEIEYIQRQLTSFSIQNMLYVLAYGVDISEIKKNEAQLSTLKQFYETILEKLPADIAIFDKNHKYIYLNPIAIKDDTLRKYIIGKDDFEYARYRGRDTNGAEVRRKKFLEAVKTKNIVGWEDESPDVNGNIHTKFRMFYPAFTATNKFDFMIGYGIDITEIKKNQQKVIKNEAKIESIMQSAHDAIIIIDASGVISFANPATENMFGWELNEMLNKPIVQTTFHHRLMPFLNKEFGKYKNNKENTVFNKLTESFAYKKTGERIQIELTVIPLEVDGEISFCAFIKDISERKKSEKVILDFNTNLEKEIKQRTSQLEAAVKELDSFSYSVSHDLKSPLRGIGGYALALSEDYGSILNEDGNDLIAKIQNSAIKMNMLIDDMLKLSKVGRTDLYRAKINISELAIEIIEQIKEDTTRKEVKFTVEPNMFLNCDKKLFEILLTNLISNAVKFSNKREIPEVSIGKTGDAEKEIFYVKDNGAGFNMKAAANLFGAFQRLHKQEDFEGTGIGLATVQRVINLHGGQVWAESKVNEGAIFYFQLNNLAD